jgi:hypothetical protein
MRRSRDAEKLKLSTDGSDSGNKKCSSLWYQADSSFCRSRSLGSGGQFSISCVCQESGFSRRVDVYI